MGFESKTKCKIADLESLQIVWSLCDLRFEIESFAKRLFNDYGLFVSNTTLNQIDL